MLKLTFVSLFMLTTLSLGHANDKGGNGGGVHVCKDSVELYDFFEGRHPILHNIKVWTSDPNKTLQEYIDLGINRLSKKFPRFASDIQKKIDELLAIPQEELLQAVNIPIIADADIPLVGEGCQYAQVANWNERFALLFFNKKLFQSLDSMSQAGLYFHEVFYKLQRTLNPKNATSNDVRKLVATIFSDQEIYDKNIEAVISNKVILRFPLGGQCKLELKSLVSPVTTIDILSKSEINVPMDVTLYFADNSTAELLDGVIMESCDRLAKLDYLRIHDVLGHNAARPIDYKQGIYINDVNVFSGDYSYKPNLHDSRNDYLNFMKFEFIK